MLFNPLMRLDLGSLDWVNVAFWTTLVLITQGVIWLLPFPGFVQMDLTWVLLFLNGSSIYTFNTKKIQFKSYQAMLMLILFGIGLVALAAEANPEIHNAFSPLLNFNVRQSATRFQDLHGNPTNFMMVIGLAMAYGGLVGIAWMAYMRRAKRFAETRIKS